jgi:HK97 gp10 family phage protein
MAVSSVRFTVAEWHGDAFMAALQDYQVQQMHEAVDMVKADMQGSIRPGGGPSSPGGPPHSQSGELRGAFTTRVTRNQQGATGTIGNTAPHALFLEFGTRHMAARPFMRPAFARNQQRIAAVLTRPTVLNIGRLR